VDYIYLVLYSLNGCSINLTASFPVPEVKVKKSMLEQDEDKHEKKEFKMKKDMYLDIKNKWENLTGDFMT
jgi:hypothetical protein